ncbi:MAG: hypothetical protein C4K48_11030 [Candidatus Thorarchaeota archaeon]|nr:MAG: hypothetical protein C4K48_11030 [Candidatus Thorarchaeota archaeon]
MSRVLIIGANSFDSGKTQLAINVGLALIESGLSVGYFKPISGHNYWHHYEHTKWCMEKGQLVSKDATAVKNALGIKSDLLLMNPIHSMFVPARIRRPLQNLPNSLALSGATSVLVMQRFSEPTKRGVDTTMLIADELVDSQQLIIGPDEIGRLSHGAAILKANSLEAFQEYERLHYETSVTGSFGSIEKETDLVIIESFNDSAWPWERLESVDNVLVVSPGHIFGYDHERFRRAAFLMKRGNLPIREVTFGRMSDLLKPTAAIIMEPNTNFTSDQLKELGIG